MARTATPPSKEQVKINEQVRQVHAAWVKTGRPAEKDRRPQGRYAVAPELVKSLALALDRAGRTHDVSVSYKIAGKPLEDGREVITFTAVDKRPPVPALDLTSLAFSIE